MAENKHRKNGVWKMLLTSSLLFVLCSGWAVPAGAEPEKGFQIVRHYLSDIHEDKLYFDRRKRSSFSGQRKARRF